MRKIVTLALFVFAVTTSIAQEIHWVSFEEAVALQKKNPKKIIMDTYTNWCGPCKILDKKTFGNADVIQYINDNYYAVKFNAEGNSPVNFKNKTYTNPQYDASRASSRNSQHELAQFLGIRAYPTIVFLDEQADLIAPIVGYKTPQQLELYLKMFKTDRYKTLKSQDAFNTYATNFKHEFNNTNKAKNVVAKTIPKQDTNKVIAKPVAQNTTKQHTVALGETLGAISKKYYNSTNKYYLIYEANKTILDSPNAIRKGQILTIPSL